MRVPQTHTYTIKVSVYDSSQQKSALISDIDCSELRTFFLVKYLQIKRKIKCLDHFGSNREKFVPKTINFWSEILICNEMVSVIFVSSNMDARIDAPDAMIAILLPNLLRWESHFRRMKFYNVKFCVYLKRIRTP